MRVDSVLVEFWDRVGIPEQNAMIGRDRDEGAPLDGTSETDLPDYAADPDGAVIPLDAHIRPVGSTGRGARGRRLSGGPCAQSAGAAGGGASRRQGRIGP